MLRYTAFNSSKPETLSLHSHVLQWNALHLLNKMVIAYLSLTVPLRHVEKERYLYRADKTEINVY